jgi:hypothetical protein
VQASAVLPSTKTTWPPAISLPQEHLPGFVDTELHLHSGPQLHQYITADDCAAFSTAPGLPAGQFAQG